MSKLTETLRHIINRSNLKTKLNKLEKHVIITLNNRSNHLKDNTSIFFHSANISKKFLMTTFINFDKFLFLNECKMFLTEITDFVIDNPWNIKSLLKHKSLYPAKSIYLNKNDFVAYNAQASNQEGLEFHIYIFFFSFPFKTSIHYHNSDFLYRFSPSLSLEINESKAFRNDVKKKNCFEQ